MPTKPTGNPPWRPTKYRAEMCERVIEIGKTGASLARMALELEVDRETMSRYRKKHPAFAAAVKKARLESLAWWERKLEEVAFGEHAELDDNGRYTARPANATLIIFRMKSQFRDEYGEQPKQSDDNAPTVITNGMPGPGDVPQ